MMKVPHSSARCRPRRQMLVACCWCSVVSLAQASQTSAPDDAAGLERMFWHCDYAATHALVGQADAQACVVATDRFRRTRFGGDLGALLQWWRVRKPAEHAAIERDALHRRAGTGSVREPAVRGSAR